MPILNADDYIAATRERVQIIKTGIFTVAGANPSSSLDVGGKPGNGSLTIGNTTTGVVPTDATNGYPLISPFAVGAKGYLGGAAFKSSVPGGAVLYDRLWHAGSISATALATTNFSGHPAYSQRLPGGTDYDNLEILLEINTAFSATATTIAVGYTNQDGATGRSTGASSSLSGFISRRLIRLPLQAGDKAPQRIDSATVGGTVATAGTFNVILARRLDDFDVRLANAKDTHSWDMTNAPEVFDDMALWAVLEPDSTSSGVFSMNIDIWSK